MVSLKQRQSGFTIVELLIVIVIIGILATLVIVTFSGVQQRARDSERKTDINAVAGQLEAFYASNGYYPPQVDFESATFRDANEIRIDTKAFDDPSDNAGDAFTAGVAAGGSNPPREYFYQAYQEDGTTACNTAAAQCASYVVSANLEGRDPIDTYRRESN
jgi:prepilin-type N-terminal cleavage/methylation domain-containing protein